MKDEMDALSQKVLRFTEENKLLRLKTSELSAELRQFQVSNIGGHNLTRTTLR